MNIQDVKASCQLYFSCSGLSGVKLSLVAKKFVETQSRQNMEMCRKKIAAIPEERRHRLLDLLEPR